MSTNSNSTTFGRVSMLSLSAFVAFAWLATDALFSGPAQALPPTGAGGPATCTFTTYYSDAKKTKEVGTFSTCPNTKGLHGSKTRYYKVETINLRVIPEGQKHGAPGGLPCEFLANGQERCINLPTPRN